MNVSPFPVKLHTQAHSVSAVSAAECIRVDEVAAALKKTKRHKAPRLSGLVAEMMQATGDIGTQWILHNSWCN